MDRLKQVPNDYSTTSVYNTPVKFRYMQFRPPQPFTEVNEFQENPGRTEVKDNRTSYVGGGVPMVLSRLMY